MDIRVASIQLDIVNTPLSKSVGILLHVVNYARVASTGLVAIVFIDAKFETQAMNLYMAKPSFNSVYYIMSKGYLHSQPEL